MSDSSNWEFLTIMLPSVAAGFIAGAAVSVYCLFVSWRALHQAIEKLEEAKRYYKEALQLHKSLYP